MANDWIETTVGEVFDLIPGFAFKSRDFQLSGAPVIKIKNVKSNRVVYDNLAYVDHSFLATKQRYIVQPEDLLITMSGNRHDGTPETWVGKIAQFRDKKPYLINQRVGILRPKPHVEVDRRYCAYVLSSWSYQELFIAIATSSGGQANLSPSQIFAAELVLPPLRIQRRIADILGTLDDKIELNRRINETLEAMARRLFKSWFVDFDPVHAKAALRREHPKLSNADLSRRALPNMSPEIAELFPDSFDDSPLGPIPMGWRAGVIGDLATLDKSSVNPSAFPNEMFDHYSIPAFDSGLNPAIEPGDQIKSNKFVVTPNCVLLTKLNPRIPRVWLPFPSTSRRSLCSTEFLVLKPRPAVSTEYLFSLVSSRSFFEVYETMVTGTSGSHQRIRPEHLLKMEVVIPVESVRRGFADLACDQFADLEMLRRESATLATTRNRLLPPLLSGSIQIPSPLHVVDRST